MNNDEMEQKMKNLTDEERTKLADLLEYPSVIFMMTDNFLKTMKQLMNILNAKNDFNRLCATKMACACETLSNTNAVIMSLIQNENAKFLEGNNGTTEENSISTNSEN